MDNLKKDKTSLQHHMKNKTRLSNNDSNGISGYHAFIGVLFGLIFLGGILGNFLVLLVVKKNRAMQTTANFLLANLATADLASLLGLLPRVLQSYFKDQPGGRVGHYICMFLTAGNVGALALTVSIITLAVLAFERYMALLKPMREKWRLNEENVKYAIVSAWTISIAFLVPYFLRTTYDEKKKDCTQDWASHTEQLIYLTCIFSFLFVIPYLVIMFCYFSIIKGIYFSNQICPMDTGNSEADARSKKRVVEVLLIVTLSFTVCVGSFALVNLLKETGNVHEESLIFHLAGALLFANSGVNPVIYAFRSTNYKEAFKEILKGLTARS